MSVQVPIYLAGGGGELPIMVYKGRLQPKGVPFSGFSYTKRVGFSYIGVCGEGREISWYLKGPKRANRHISWM